jgi:hypothetical protein
MQSVAITHYRLQRDTDPVKPSCSLGNDDARSWVEASAQQLQFLNTILSLIHPQLWKNAKGALEKLRHDPLTKDAAKRWTSVFTGIAVIANRKTKRHRDHYGAAAWYDLLLTLGSYENATLDMDELGLEMEYKPGTLVAICGNALFHRVNDWGPGDRVCYALFMRKAVLDRLHSGWVGWTTRDIYTS